MKLTLKQEAFCREYIANNGNATQAYKKAYDCKKMKEATINNNAYKLLQNNEIKTRITELKQPLQEKFEYTMEQSFKKFEEIQKLALANEKPDLTNAIKCEENKAKLMGLYASEKVNITSNIKKVFITKDDEKEANKKIDDFINNIDV